MEAYAWDLETNTMTSQKFTVKHVRDTNARGKVDPTDERDIYEIGANMGARRLRARISRSCRRTWSMPQSRSVAPPSKASRTCRWLTASARWSTPSPASVFAPSFIERRLGKKLDEMLPEELADLRVIYKSIKDGIATASEHFNQLEPAAAEAAEARPERPSALAKVAAAGKARGCKGRAGSGTAARSGAGAAPAPGRPPRRTCRVPFLTVPHVQPARSFDDRNSSPNAGASGPRTPRSPTCARRRPAVRADRRGRQGAGPLPPVGNPRIRTDQHHRRTHARSHP